MNIFDIATIIALAGCIFAVGYGLWNLYKVIMGYNPSGYTIPKRKRKE